jgi:putative Holliday junction resolvase
MSQPPTNPPRPRRLLALDAGERRTGVAVSDDLGMLAHPRPAIRARDRAELVRSVAATVSTEQADEVVIGIPVGMDGQDTAQSRVCRELARDLRSMLAVPVTEWDERLSTVAAARFVRGRERRASGDLDSAAAAIVLQGVLDARRPRG